MKPKVAEMWVFELVQVASNAASESISGTLIITKRVITWEGQESGHSKRVPFNTFEITFEQGIPTLWLL